MVHRDVAVMEAREQDLPLQFLQGPLKTNSTTRRLAPDPSGDILREHDPSLGKSPHPSGDFEPVILTSPRLPSEKGRSIELDRQAPAAMSGLSRSTLSVAKATQIVQQGKSGQIF